VLGWRNNRIVGYQGESHRPSSQLQSGANGSSVRVGSPIAPAKCTIDVSTAITDQVVHDRRRIGEVINLSAERLEHERAARPTLIIASVSLPPRTSDWTNIFADPMVATAVIDRLVHHGTVFEFACDIQRLKARQRRSTNTTPGTNKGPTNDAWPAGEAIPGSPARTPEKSPPG
jgi:hypothetical protein